MTKLKLNKNALRKLVIRIRFYILSVNWVHLYKQIEYENKPGENNSHWRTPVYLFDEPVAVQAGDVIEVKAILTNDYVWFCQVINTK